MPAKVTLYNLKCEPVFDFGTGPRNAVYYNPHGNDILLIDSFSYYVCVADVASGVFGQRLLGQRSSFISFASFRLQVCTMVPVIQ